MTFIFTFVTSLENVKDKDWITLGCQKYNKYVRQFYIENNVKIAGCLGPLSTVGCVSFIDLSFIIFYYFIFLIFINLWFYWNKSFLLRFSDTSAVKVFYILFSLKTYSKLESLLLFDLANLSRTSCLERSSSNEFVTIGFGAPAMALKQIGKIFISLLSFFYVFCQKFEQM